MPDIDHEDDTAVAERNPVPQDRAQRGALAVPSGYRIEQAVSQWQAARARLMRDDPFLVDDEAALTGLLGTEMNDVKELLARVCRAAKHAEAMGEAAKIMAAKIAARQRRYEAREETLRGLAMSMMEALGTRREEYADLTVGITAGRQGVHITDVDKVPDIYVEVSTERKPDKATIFSALRAGKTVPGAELRNGAPIVTIRS